MFSSRPFRSAIRALSALPARSQRGAAAEVHPHPGRGDHPRSRAPSGAPARRARAHAFGNGGARAAPVRGQGGVGRSVGRSVGASPGASHRLAGGGGWGAYLGGAMPPRARAPRERAKAARGERASAGARARLLLRAGGAGGGHIARGVPHSTRALLCWHSLQLPETGSRRVAACCLLQRWPQEGLVATATFGAADSA